MSKGLTLIETVISIAIISMGVALSITAFPLGIKLADLNNRSSTALFLASAQIETVVYQGYEDTEEGIFIEDFGDILNFEGYKRETEVSCFSPEGNCIPGIKKVEVSVYSKLSLNKKTTLIVLINE